DADVTFRSVDGQLFHLQRKYLEANTGAFPGREFDTRGETTDLTESADILDLLFQFVYPRRDPDIDNLDFETLLGFAEAAEKYEVFHAMTITVPVTTSPTRAIISHASRHDYPSLIEELIPHLARRSVVEVAQELPSRYIIPWVCTFVSAFLIKSLIDCSNISFGIGIHGIQFLKQRWKMHWPYPSLPRTVVRRASGILDVQRRRKYALIAFCSLYELYES
ncbi:hypothetical protein CPC08DRAFT_641664, partial [Agrocybe pediades]